MAALDTGKTRMADKTYKYEISQTYGVKTCSQNLNYNFMLKMIIDVLTWNQTASYLDSEEVTCLESILTHTNNC